MELWILLISLLVILIGAETFTNALEHFGERLRISEGVTGSVFAAVGTALPETMVPVVAVLDASGDLSVRHDVGVGAILGAPLMLSTITLFLMGMFAAQRRGWTQAFCPESTGVHRDLDWFLFAFALATLAVFVPSEWHWARVSLALGLTVSYFVYLLLTIRASGDLVAQGHGTKADHPLFLSWIRVPENLATILLQLVIGFGFIIGGAKGFVYGVASLAAWLGGVVDAMGSTNRRLGGCRVDVACHALSQISFAVPCLEALPSDFQWPVLPRFWLSHCFWVTKRRTVPHFGAVFGKKRFVVWR